MQRWGEERLSDAGINGQEGGGGGGARARGNLGNSLLAARLMGAKEEVALAPAGRTAAKLLPPRLMTSK